MNGDTIIDRIVTEGIMKNGGGNRIPVLDRVSSAIYAGRFIIFGLFAVACALCALMLGRVRINSDLTHFLPEETETRRGIAVMSEEFVTYSSASVMIKGATEDEAQRLTDEMSKIDGVYSASYEAGEGCCLISVSFKLTADDPAAKVALESVKEAASSYENYVRTTVGQDFSKKLASEMGGILLIAAIVIFTVLIITSRSYFEVAIYFVVFAVAALLNMGTNFIFGEISSITNSVAVILQLALAIDYAIIFAHRYSDEAIKRGAGREAIIASLSRSTVEIASSSLTTVSGLVALMLMQFRLGYDLGIVLAKGIVCSMLTVLLLMPGLISLFPRAIEKTAHRPFLPSIKKWGEFLAKRGIVFVLLFALVVPAAIVLSTKTEYAFSDGSIDELVHSETRDAARAINAEFSPSTSVAVIIPRGDYAKERELSERLKNLDGVNSVTGIADIELPGGMMLTDSVGIADVSALLGVPEEQTTLLFKGFAAEKRGDLSALLGDVSDKKFPLVDLAIYLFEKIDGGAVELTAEQKETLASVRGELEYATDQLIGKKYDRLVLSSSLPAEGDESVALIDKIKDEATALFGKDNLVTGDITSARDLRESYKSDSVLIALLTIAFVFLILFVTFRSPVAALLLVFVIQGSIWINFSIPYLLGLRGSFVTQMIVSAIQMGATIDYAIVMFSRYKANRETNDKKTAVALAVAESFPTVITSGAIMSVAGFLIAFRVSDVYVGHIGFAVGRGALISVILVLSVLPVLIMLFDKAIEKTTIHKK